MKGAEAKQARAGKLAGHTQRCKATMSMEAKIAAKHPACRSRIDPASQKMQYTGHIRAPGHVTDHHLTPHGDCAQYPVHDYRVPGTLLSCLCYVRKASSLSF